MKLFNETSSGKKPSWHGICLNASQDEITVKRNYISSNHPSIQKCIFDNNSKFDLPEATASDINKIIKSLDTNKAARPDVLLFNIISCDIAENKYLEHAKTRAKTKNWWPVF